MSASIACIHVPVFNIGHVSIIIMRLQKLVKTIYTSCGENVDYGPVNGFG